VLRFLLIYYTRRTKLDTAVAALAELAARGASRDRQNHRDRAKLPDHAPSSQHCALNAAVLETATTVIGDGAAICWPPESQQVDFEG